MNREEKIEVQAEMDAFIEEMNRQGVSQEPDPNDVGLGDAVEFVLTKLGITQERYKAWRGLDECDCTERKHYLNKIFPNIDPFGIFTKNKPDRNSVDST